MAIYGCIPLYIYIYICGGCNWYLGDLFNAFYQSALRNVRAHRPKCYRLPDPTPAKLSRPGTPATWSSKINPLAPLDPKTLRCVAGKFHFFFSSVNGVRLERFAPGAESAAGLRFTCAIRIARRRRSAADVLVLATSSSPSRNARHHAFHIAGRGHGSNAATTRCRTTVCFSWVVVW